MELRKLELDVLSALLVVVYMYILLIFINVQVSYDPLILTH
jgi:hypothetical protein